MRYTRTTKGVSVEDLKGGFFVGWPHLPSAKKHLELLDNSDYIVLAVEEQSNIVVGYVTAVSDGVLSAYIPLLEVLPAYQGRGIGKRLMEEILADLEDFYMIDLLCEEELQPYYEGLGMRKARGMMKRNYKKAGG
ncbi:GNAT family N-acetyltransferase [Shouchella shacheensis]|uniref:GNAT family N-acetyltransferase n=1 Tax=Shouchella shacheensis TaxID=1649580 RepID=UPI00074033F7|nr:GNAT family N-acetyltransferase [Shouchella shacheensis]